MLVRDPKTARIGEEILPFEVGYLPEFFQKKAEVELHETPEKIVQCTRQMREMAKRDKRLKDIEVDDHFLLQYLRARKFNVERAFSNLKVCVNFTRKYPENFVNFKFEEIVKTVNDKIANILPWRCQDGCAILLVELGNWKPDTFPLSEVKRMIVVVLLQALQDPMTQVNGFKVIFDVKISSLRLLKHCTPHNLYLLYHGTQECIPGRFKAVHIVNDSVTFKTAWIVIKHFFSDKLRKRVHFHSSPSTLLDFFPEAVLPVGYGGDLEDYDQTEWLQKVMTPEELARMGGGILKNLKEKS